MNTRKFQENKNLLLQNFKKYLTLMASKILENSNLSSFLTEVRHKTDAVFLWTICKKGAYIHKINAQGKQEEKEETQHPKDTYRTQSCFSLDNAVRDFHLPTQSWKPNHQFYGVHIMSNDHKLCFVLQ